MAVTNALLIIWGCSLTTEVVGVCPAVNRIPDIPRCSHSLIATG
jgi:hypothetical protein